MSPSRQHLRRIASVVIIGVATLIASIVGHDPISGVAGIALLVVLFGGAEVARRRGSGAGAAFSGDLDERTGRLYERAAARTALMGYLALVGWVVYGIAAGTDTDGPGLAIVAFSTVFYGNVAWLTWAARARSTRAAGAR